MAGGAGRGVREGLGVEREAERGLDARAEGLGEAEDEKTDRVDLGLDKGGGVEVVLGADLEGDLVGGRLGVVDGLGAGLGRNVDAVVVRGREDREVAEGVDGGRVLGGGVADGGGVLGDGTRDVVVGGLTANKEAVPGNDSVGGDGGALEEESDMAEGLASGADVARDERTHLEEVDGTGGVNTGVLVGGTEDGTLGVLGRVEGGSDVELEALGEDRVELGRRLQEVRRVPGLASEGEMIASASRASPCHHPRDRWRAASGGGRTWVTA